jgi:hypothetical protein
MMIFSYFQNILWTLSKADMTFFCQEDVGQKQDISIGQYRDWWSKKAQCCSTNLSRESWAEHYKSSVQKLHAKQISKRDTGPINKRLPKNRVDVMFNNRSRVNGPTIKQERRVYTHLMALFNGCWWNVKFGKKYPNTMWQGNVCRTLHNL